MAFLPLNTWGQAEPLPEQAIRFVQLTDAHIFDDGWKLPIPEAMRQAADDREALHWAIEQVNELVSSGVHIDFVVYTGDLGLQNVDVPKDVQCSARQAGIERGLPLATLRSAVDEVADELNQLAVRKVLIVPGNNDLIDEDGTDTGRYDCFVRRLQVRLRASALAVIPLDTDGVVINGFRVIGLNTASFKSLKNYETACVANPPASAARAPLRSCPRFQIESLRASAGARIVLFTHVPDLRDPFRKTPSWEIDADVRKVWEEEVCKPRVIALFAGHFHDSNRALYGDSLGTRDLALSQCVADKTLVAPPLAIKNQVDKQPRARGLLLATVTPSVARAKVFWFPEPPVKSTARWGVLGRWKWAVVLFVAVVIGVAGLVGLGRASTSGKGGYRDTAALVAVVVFLVVALATVWVTKKELGITDSATLIALLVLPLVLYGIVSGRLTEFTGPGGWGAKFREAAQRPVDLSLAPVDLKNTEIETIRKTSHAELQRRLGQGRIREGRPLIMTMTMGHGNYDVGTLSAYLRDLSQFPNFKFVVFVDAQNRLVGYVAPQTLQRALEFSPAEVAFLVTAVNEGDEATVRAFPGVITETISSRTTNAEALEEMEKLGVDALVVTDENTRNVIGVVDRERILGQMVSALTKSARA